MIVDNENFFLHQAHALLQESEGRWLKLLSGLVILALGVVMIFWPDKLI